MASGQNLLQPEEKEFQTFYKRSLLWIKWRPILKRMGIGALIIFDVLTISYATYRFLDYGVISFFNERAMIGSIVQGIDTLHAITQSHAATTLKVSDPLIFPLDDGRADFYAEMTNTSSDWQAVFSYAFSYGSETTTPQNGFILPGEKAKPLTGLAVRVTSVPKSAKLVLSDLVWTRVNHHAITDYASWQDDRLSFPVTSVAYDPAFKIDTATVGRTSFTIKNASSFGYWSPSFTVVLLRNEKVVGVTTTTVPEFASGETQNVIVNWFGTPPQSNATLILPNIDIFDPSVYMPLQGQLVPDVRERIKVGR